MEKKSERVILKATLTLNYLPEAAGCVDAASAPTQTWRPFTLIDICDKRPIMSYYLSWICQCINLSCVAFFLRWSKKELCGVGRDTQVDVQITRHEYSSQQPKSYVMRNIQDFTRPMVSNIKITTTVLSTVSVLPLRFPKEMCSMHSAWLV